MAIILIHPKLRKNETMVQALTLRFGDIIVFESHNGHYWPFLLQNNALRRARRDGPNIIKAKVPLDKESAHQPLPTPQPPSSANMFKLSAVFITSLLAGATIASPAVGKRQGPPDQDNICRPSGIDSTVKYFIQSAADSKVWQAEGVSASSFSFVDLQTKATGSNAQLWSIFPINHGDSFSFVSSSVNSANICANGDGGPLDTAACPDVASRQAPQFAQWFITCKTCASDGRGATGCQIQSAGEGQCANFLDNTSTTVKLDDCSPLQPNEFWNIVPAA
ncbi:hypothetical protein BJ165DRAFT_1481782 [Panaeolus papilionaceus]|nr:hypothetical protein BJ165DRAFT_1481782 [Panaeolus papilionaceus]